MLNNKDKRGFFFIIYFVAAIIILTLLIFLFIVGKEVILAFIGFLTKWWWAIALSIASFFTRDLWIPFLKKNPKVFVALLILVFLYVLWRLEFS